MVVLSLIVAIVVQGIIIKAKQSILPEAVQYAITSSFNNTAGAGVLHMIIETEFNENTIKFLDVFDKILVKENYWSFGFQIDVNNKNGQAVCDHNLWFIDSYEAFYRLLPWIESYHRDSQLYYFIVFKHSDTNDNNSYLYILEKIFSDFFRLMLANVNILIETATGEVWFYTFYPFQELGRCRSTKPFVVLKFLKNSTKIQHSLFPPKASNFYGCTLHLKTRNGIILKLDNFVVYFIETVIVKELASRLNFTVNIVKARFTEKIVKDMLHDKNSSGSYHKSPMHNGEIDMIMGLYINDPEINRFLSKSAPYVLTPAIIGFQYRPSVLEEYVWPLIAFDSITWMCILLWFLLIAACTFYVKRTKGFLSGIVQLEHVGFLEILAVSIGSSVEHLPKKNCLRFAFVVLSLGALVLRTAYLGKLFDAYRGYSPTQQPRDFMELLEENYTLYAHAYYASFINSLIGMESIHFKVITSKELDFLFDSEKKSALFTTFLFFYGLATPEQRRQLVIESYFGQHVCIFFHQHSFIAPKVNEIIEKLEESGILHYFRQGYEDVRAFGFSPENIMRRENENQEEKQPLSYEQFSSAFYLFIGSIVISCLVFTAELLWDKIFN